MQYFKRIC